MDNLIARVLEDDWASLQTDIEKMAAEKVKEKIDAKKINVLAQINGVDVEKMKEILTPTAVETGAEPKVEDTPTETTVSA